MGIFAVWGADMAKLSEQAIEKSSKGEKAWRYKCGQ